MRARGRVASAVLLACLLAGVAGCGAAGPLSNAQLRDRAADLCSAATLRLDRIPTPSSPAGGAAFIASGMRIVQSEQRQLGELRADDPRYRGAVGELSLELRAMRSAVRGLHSGNDPVVAIKTLQAHLGPIEGRAAANWGALGAPSCEDR
jgi:hypothetical protein